MKVVGKPIQRVDAFSKANGSAKYTADLLDKKALVAKVLHSTIAHGRVISFDLKKAKKVDGVVKIFTCFDVPDYVFPTAGHPWSTHKNHQDIADRKLLNTHVRYYGDEIAVVVAEDEIAASRALKLIKVEYEEYESVFTVEDALKEGAPVIHSSKPNNIIVRSEYEMGDFEKAISEENLVKFEGDYTTPVVQHCHIENAISFAYKEANKVVVVASTQIPHIVRRIVSQALGIGTGSVRIIKPYIGGGFGNKQDSLMEPLNAWLTTQLDGKLVKLFYTREETFVSTRTRHAMKFHIESYVRQDGTLAARSIKAYSNQGAYASHAHALVANAVNAFRMMYPVGSIKGEAYTVYTNMPTAGAMRAYGIPQSAFALESHMDEIASKMGFDKVEFRKKNMMRLGFVDPYTTITCHSTGLEDCIEKGKKYVDYDAKVKEYENQTGDIRKGIGMAILCYKTGVYPIALETSSARLILNQDGSVQLQAGATEIGQGADTVFSQMVAETVGLTFDKVHITSTQDTDVTPFDTAAYGSRQSYVSGMAIKKTALEFKKKILNYAGFMLNIDPMDLDIVKNKIVRKGQTKCELTVSDVALESCYSIEKSEHIVSEETHHCTDNTYAFGCCFVDLEVDIPFGQVKINKIINVHDSGRILNPILAKGQVQGAMSMGLGYGLFEKLIYDDKGKTLNDNLLDYKLMTTMDTPDLAVDFVQAIDPTGPYGNKSLGEPGVIPMAPAVRNAIFNATGVAVNTCPLDPETLFNAFSKAGLIK